ncbi:MAG: tryptophan dimethylallyltransferase family protein [Myxococcales bacterium]|nr:tryptophan dimethylallyltransferase family protein [Myxococcales bacterium]
MAQRRASSGQSFRAVAERKLSSLTQGMELSGAQYQRTIAALDKLTGSFAHEPVGDQPLWGSDIADDGSPVEISVAMADGRFDLRLLAETQSTQAGKHFGWDAALALNDRLQREAGADLSRFQKVADLFVPDPRIAPRFSLWHGAVVPEEGPTRYKLYLNPQVLGEALAPALTREMLERLDLQRAWTPVQNLLAVNGRTNQLFYASLDLVPGPSGRVKLYIAHHGVQASSLETQLAQFERYEAGHATQLVSSLSDHDGPFDQRPILTCLSFTEASDVPAVTLHFPVRCYVQNDAELCTRLGTALAGEPFERLQRGIAAFAGRDLSAGRGLVSYVSSRGRAHGSDARTVVYLALELYQVAPPSGLQRAHRTSMVVPKPRASESDSAMSVVLQHIGNRKDRLSAHSFLRHLETSDNASDVATVTEGLAFFVLAFQDVLRLAADRINDANLRDIATEHYREDAGHENWFLHDAQQLGIAVDARHLFSWHHSIARDVGYELVAEVLRAQHDPSRLVVVLALEAIGDLFFERIISLLERAGANGGLRYFGRHHQDVERNHAVFEDSVQSKLLNVDLREYERRQALSSVECVFDQMHMLADQLFADVCRANTGDGVGA